MDLNNRHREALIEALEDALEAEARANNSINRFNEERTNSQAGHALEIDHWLAKQKVFAIREALINNEIDY